VTGNRDNIIPLLQFLPEIRKAIHTTNAIASLNKVMRKLTGTDRSSRMTMRR
jgi:transposase-like protein